MLNQIIDAIDEGYKVFDTIGYSILPVNEENFIHKKRYLFYLLLKVVMITPIDRLTVSDQAMTAVEEMTALNSAFDGLKHIANIMTPNWDSLEKYIRRFNISTS